MRSKPKSVSLQNNIAELCPTISVSAVEKAIAALMKDGKVKKIRTGQKHILCATKINILVKTLQNF